MHERTEKGAVNSRSLIGSLRKSATNKILGKVDLDSDSDSSSDSDSKSSSSDSEIDKRRSKPARPPVTRKRRIISSAMNNVKSSFSRAKNPTPSRNTRGRNRGAHATVSKIRKSLTKKKVPPSRVPPPKEESSSSSDDDSSSSDSSTDKGPRPKSGKSKDDDSSSSSEILPRIAKNPNPNADVVGIDRDEPTGGILEASNEQLITLQGEGTQKPSMKPPMQQYKSERFAKQDLSKSAPAEKQSSHNKPSLQKYKSERMKDTNGGTHQSQRPKRHTINEDRKRLTLQKYSSERKIEVPSRELKPSKTKSSRHVLNEASARNKPSLTKTQSTKVIKSQRKREGVENVPDKRKDGSLNNSDKSNNDLERSTSSRLSSRPSISANDTKAKNDTKARELKTRKTTTRGTTKPDPPTQTPLVRRRQTALQRINELASSFKSSFSSGAKLSGHAKSALTDADVPQDVDAAKKPSKARSTKSKSSRIVSEKSSNDKKSTKGEVAVKKKRNSIAD